MAKPYSASACLASTGRNMLQALIQTKGFSNEAKADRQRSGTCIFSLESKFSWLPSAKDANTIYSFRQVDIKSVHPRPTTY